MPRLNDFKPNQVVKIKEGDLEKVYPLYDLNILRAFMLHTDDIPSEIPEQIIYNCERVKNRLEVSPDIIEEPVALVAYGPTLNKFGKYLDKFKTIISMSGSHKILVDRDIIPTYHVDVDFRERKAVHTKESHPDVEYLFGSIVHKAMLDNVEGKRCKLWHVALKGIEYPEGELVLEGYWDVGQEAILVAKALGYRNLHLFGYDYAFDVDSGVTHAGFHNSVPQSRIFARVGEKLFQTSDSLARGVLTFTKLMTDNSDLNLTIYSDGLLSAYLDYHYKDNIGNEHTKIATN